MIVDEDTHNLPMLKNDWFSYASKKAPVYKADTIEGLAKEAGLNPEELKKIVDEYNTALKEGKLDQLTPPNTHKNPRPILKAPFYAVPFQGGMTATFGGPLINTKGQVLDTEGKPIKGFVCSRQCRWRSVLRQLRWGAQLDFCLRYRQSHR